MTKFLPGARVGPYPLEPRLQPFLFMNLIEGSAQCGHDRWRSTCAIETIGRVRVFWSLENWNHVSGTAEMALHCAVVLALFFWFCVCVFVCLCWLPCVCVCPFFALLVLGLAWIF